MVHAILDHQYRCRVLYLQTVSQHLEAGKCCRASDDLDRIRCPGSGIFCWYAVHGDENAEILLFHRISAKLFTDNRYAFFLSDTAFLY